MDIAINETLSDAFMALGWIFHTNMLPVNHRDGGSEGRCLPGCWSPCLPCWPFGVWWVRDFRRLTRGQIGLAATEKEQASIGRAGREGGRGWAGVKQLLLIAHCGRERRGGIPDASEIPISQLTYPSLQTPRQGALDVVAVRRQILDSPH